MVDRARWWLAAAFPLAVLSLVVSMIFNLAPAGDPEGVFPIERGLTGQAIRSGEAIRVDTFGGTEGIRRGREQDVSALIVPLRSVHTEGGQSYVYRMAGAHIERVEVELGLMTDTEIEGIKKGIVLNGMSKEAVLVCYGYPPEHRTRNFYHHLYCLPLFPGGQFLEFPLFSSEK